MDAIYIMYNNWAFLSVIFLIFLLCFHLLNDNFHSNNCPQTSVQLPGYPKCLQQKSQMLGTQTTVQLNSPQAKIKIESQMLDCTHILEIVPSPTQGTQTTVQHNNPPNATDIRIKS